MVEMQFKNEQLQCKSLENNSFLLKNSYQPGVLELAQDMYIFEKLIIKKMAVLRQVDTYDHVYDPIKVSQFSLEQLPFVIIRDREGFYLVNIKTCAKPQLLVKAVVKKQGFCISSEQDSFDFHFAHTLTEDDKSRYEVHSRFCFRSDLI